MHFRTFNRNFVYFLWIEDLTLQSLITLNGINMTPAFLKKDSINSLPKNLYFAKFRILKLFVNTFFTYYMHLELLYRCLNSKCYQCNNKVCQNFFLITCFNQSYFLFFKTLYNLLLLILLINPWSTPNENIISFIKAIYININTYIYVTHIYRYVCVCMYIYIYIYIYMCVCVCMYVCIICIYIIFIYVYRCVYICIIFICIFYICINMCIYMYLY